MLLETDGAVSEVDVGTASDEDAVHALQSVVVTVRASLRPQHAPLSRVLKRNEKPCFTLLLLKLDI